MLFMYTIILVYSPITWKESKLKIGKSTVCNKKGRQLPYPVMGPPKLNSPFLWAVQVSISLQTNQSDCNKLWNHSTIPILLLTDNYFSSPGIAVMHMSPSFPFHLATVCTMYRTCLGHAASWGQSICSHRWLLKASAPATAPQFLSLANSGQIT